MQFRIQELTTSEDRVFIPQYRENDISNWKNFIDPIYRVGYAHHSSLTRSEEFIDNILDSKKQLLIIHEYYRGNQDE